MPQLPRLHIITDTVQQQRYSHLELAEMAWIAGDCAVQHRDKRLGAASMESKMLLLELADMALRAKALGRTLLVNDRPDLAAIVGAQGAHIGQEDGSVAKARQLLGGGRLLGATVHSLEELEALKGSEIDYIGVGPVYGTRSKATGLPDLGLDGLERICAASPWPVIAIGGIDLDGMDACLRAGAYGVAIISAFCNADDPQAVAREMLARMG